MTGLGYLTSNKEAAYPFSDEAAMLAQPGVEFSMAGLPPKLPRDFFLDAVVTVPPGVTAAYLRYVVVAGGAVSFSVADQNADVICTGTCDTTLPMGRTLQISNAVTGAWLRASVGEDYARFLAAVSGTIDYYDGLPFEACVVEARPERLLKVRVAAEDGSPIDLDGDVALIEGYNIRLSPAPGANGAITMESGLGYGAGAKPCEHPPAPLGYLGSVNGQRGDDNGNIAFDSDDCYTFSRVADGLLAAFNSCSACCTCADYQVIANKIGALLGRAKATRDDSMALAAELNAAISDYNTVGFHKRNPGLTLRATAVRSMMGGTPALAPVNVSARFDIYYKSCGDKITDLNFHAVAHPDNYAITTTTLVTSGIEPVNTSTRRIIMPYLIPVFPSFSHAVVIVQLVAPQPTPVAGSATLWVSWVDGLRVPHRSSVGASWQ